MQRPSANRSADEVVIAAVARTPFGRYNGALSAFTPPSLAAMTIDEVVRRAGIKPDAVGCVYAGAGMIGGSVLTAARQAVLMSALPESTPSIGVDRACCSGMTALGLAYKDVLAGTVDAVIAGGVDSLSRTPLLWPRPHSGRVGPVAVSDPLQMRGEVVDRPIAVYTGEEALRHGVTREMQDEWACESHARYFAADAGGYFDFERFAVPSESGDGVALAKDEAPRRDSTPEKLRKLGPIYGGTTVTAGNAPGLSDGAAFMLVTSGRFAKDMGIDVLARVRGHTMIAGSPTSGSHAPAVAIDAVLERCGVTLGEVKLLEINEAFAATPLVSTLRLADGDPAGARELLARTNVHGGAVAIGHPLGATGARIVMTLVNGLRARGGGIGVAAICGGFGQGEAVLISVD